MIDKLRRVNIRRTHPDLYRRIMSIAVLQIALAFNYWWYTPTFNPYGISKNLIGVVFFVLGIFLFVFLNVRRNLNVIHATLALGAGFSLFWGIANTQQAFAGNASLALPILFVFSLCATQTWALIEAPVNPITERD